MMVNIPHFDVAGPLFFVINAASGSNDSDATRRVIEQTLHADG